MTGHQSCDRPNSQSCFTSPPRDGDGVYGRSACVPPRPAPRRPRQERIMKRSKFKQLRYVAALAACLVALSPLAATPSHGANPNPNVAPVKSSPNGRSYGEWAQAWWTWATSIPAEQNPLLDETGQFAGVGQSGHV